MQRWLRGGRGAVSVACLAAVLGLGPGLQACVVEAGVSASAGAGAGPGVVVAGPPPAPMVDRLDTRPAPLPGETVWVAGYWHWTGMRYTWIPGHWERAPAGAAWRAPRYWTSEGSYYYEPGGWVRAGR